MLRLLRYIVLLVTIQRSYQSCQSTVGVTTCENVVLARNVPLRVADYRYLVEFKGEFPELPQGVFKLLPEVKRLQLSNIKLKNVEVGAFDGLYSLEDLSLYGNKLSAIRGGSFGGLSKLKTLNLGMNEIRKVDASAFADLRRLVELNLGFNELEKVPEAINNLGGGAVLKKLHLNNNKLRSIGAGAFAGLNELQVLNLNDNEITRITNGAFSGLPNLRELNLQSNYLADLNTQNILEELKGLGTVKLSINSFSCQTLNNVVSAFEIKGVEVARGHSKSKDTVRGIGCKNTRQ